MNTTQLNEFTQIIGRIRRMGTPACILMYCILLEGSHLPEKDFPYLEDLNTATAEDFTQAIELARLTQARTPEFHSAFEAVIVYIQNTWLNRSRHTSLA